MSDAANIDGVRLYRRTETHTYVADTEEELHVLADELRPIGWVAEAILCRPTADGTEYFLVCHLDHTAHPSH